MRCLRGNEKESIISWASPSFSIVLHARIRFASSQGRPPPPTPGGSVKSFSLFSWQCLFSVRLPQQVNASVPVPVP
jgi:hypothetical protein